MTVVLGVLTGLLLQASPAPPVCGTVASYRTTGNSARGCAVILTLNVPATEAATKAVEVRIDDATRRQMGRPPWQFFQQEACVKGAFDSAYSMPTILVTNPSQVEIKGAGAAAFGHDAVSGCDAAVTAPRLVKEAKPSYTADAMRDWVQGLVRVDAVVERDGTVSEARVTRSLHPQLDEEALKAIRKWRFEPGKVDGKPVRVVVDVEMTFTRR